MWIQDVKAARCRLLQLLWGEERRNSWTSQFTVASCSLRELDAPPPKAAEEANTPHPARPESSVILAKRNDE